MIQDKWNGMEYSKASSFQFQSGCELLQTHSFTGTERILDVGCGSGELTQEIYSYIPSGEIIGVDSSKNMIEFANKHYATNNIKFIQIDIENLDYQEQFDFVFSNFCLHWPKNKLRVFENLFNSLVSHGDLVARMAIRNQLLEEIGNSMIASDKWRNYFIDYQSSSKPIFFSDYDKIAKQVGFDIIDYKIELLEKIFDTKAELSAYLASTQPYHKHLDHNTQLEFMNEFVDHYITRIDKNGLYYIAFRCPTIKAKKPNKN